MKNKGALIGGLAAIILIAAAVAAMLGSNKQTANTVNTPEQSSHTESGGASHQEEAKQAEPVAQNTVDITNFSYKPETIKVKVGQMVTWTNQDSVSHDVVADTPSEDAPKSQLLGKGESYSFTFNKAGTYSYHCTPHPYMKGTVIVEE